MKLACHLPNEQSVVFQEGEEEAALERGSKHTTLTAWFALNEKMKKNQKDALENIPPVSLDPQNMEPYSKYLLLQHQTRATCYEDLRTVDKVLYPTFQAAAIALGLLED